MILSRLDDMKAEETVTIDLRGKSAFSDFMIITSGRANRHVGAIAENVTKGLKENGVTSIHVEGMPNCDWVLIDSGDVIVHVFRPEVREFYNLERLWTQNPAVAASEFLSRCESAERMVACCALGARIGFAARSARNRHPLCRKRFDDARSSSLQSAG